MGRQALLVMDFQNAVVERYADEDAGLLARVASAIDAARDATVPVIFVRVAFREHPVEISPRNLSFSRLAALGPMGADEATTQIAAALAPRPDEAIVTKRRISAFSGSDLDVVLRSLEVDTLALCGISTSGVVLSTLRQAADLDFELSVLADCCLDADDEVHRVLIEKVFPRQAAVLSALEWIGSLGNAPS